jgi:hypothetical protein
LSAALGLPDSRLSLSLSLMFFDQRCARRKNGWKCQKKSSQRWSVPLGYNAGEDGYGSPKNEPHGIFVPLRLAQSH